jgi:hypothetical protein
MKLVSGCQQEEPSKIAIAPENVPFKMPFMTLLIGHQKFGEGIQRTRGVKDLSR